MTKVAPLSDLRRVHEIFEPEEVGGDGNLFVGEAAHGGSRDSF
jgi:hypothetical protein